MAPEASNVFTIKPYHPTIDKLKWTTDLAGALLENAAATVRYNASFITGGNPPQPRHVVSIIAEHSVWTAYIHNYLRPPLTE